MQSGEFTGTQNKMSKRGQDCFAEYFSQLLLLISAPSGQTAYNPVLMEYYKNKCQSKPKKVALGLLCVSLLIIFLLFLGIESLRITFSPRARANACSEAHSSLVVLVLDV